MKAGAWNRMVALAQMDLRILRRDPAFMVVFTAMPLLFMAFNRELVGSALVAAGEGVDATQAGVRFVVPAATVLFSGFLVGNIGFSTFREHGWGTWERLRSSELTSFELMAGKALGPMGLSMWLITVLLGGGGLLFGLELAGSLAAYAAVAVALGISQVALGFMLLSLCRSVIQLNALTNAGAMALDGLGGALAPVELMPGWAQAAAPLVPTYWAMRGFRSVAVDGAGLADVALVVGVLTAFTVGFLVVALLRFRVEDTKVSWA